MLKPYLDKNAIEAGVDEAGRGCLAGPVVAAAVILPKEFVHPGLNDSKKLTEKQRNQLKDEIVKHARSYAVSFVPPIVIDEINILQASFLAMNRAIQSLKIRPESLLIDGNRFNNQTKIPHQCIIKGDGKYLAIAAASILAKTSRDEFMVAQARRFPQYNWMKNRGYPTKSHRAAIAEFGITPLHRKSFKQLPDPDQQLELF